MPLPTPDVENATRAYKYHKKGLSSLEIGRILNVDRKTAWRWIKYFESGKLGKKVIHS